MNTKDEIISHALSIFIFLSIVFLLFLAIVSGTQKADTAAQTNQEETAKDKAASEEQENTVPTYYQWDSRWGDKSYAGATMANSGCGPTCLSMVAVYFTGDDTMTPDWMADFSTEHGYIWHGKTTWKLMGEGAESLGLHVRQIVVDESGMKKALQKGRILICSVRPGDFTKGGHFIVLTDYEDGMFSVHDPNSKENSQKKWSYDRINGQIKNIWSYWM